MATQQLTIVRGKTLNLILLDGTVPIVRKAITAISLDSGAPRITATGHGLPNGWPASVALVEGMKQINAQAEPPKESDIHESTVIDGNTVEFNEITPVDENGRVWPAYTAGGFLIYNTPSSLANKRCDVVVKDKVGGTILLSSRAADTPLDLITTTVDDTAKTITLRIEADDAAAIAWSKGVWEAEMHDTVTGDVYSLIAFQDFDDQGNVESTSSVTVLGEVAS